MKKLFICALLAQTCLGAASAHAYDLPNKLGKIIGDFRARYEYVDNDAFTNHANARTARMRLGYESPEWNKVQAYVEFETIQHLGEENYNDGLNGHTQYPGVNDPETSDLNQLFVTYKPTKDTLLKVGRQGIKLDNQRFIGWTKFRQNDVTHDAALASFSPIEKSKVTYAYSEGVHRYSGNLSPAGQYEGQLHILNGHYDWPSDIGSSVYTYLLDFDDTPAERNLSSRTHGLRLTWEPDYGDNWAPRAAAEYARQSDYGNSLLSYDENYWQAELGAEKGDFNGTFSFESLGGNGTTAMQTPIASAHNINGWADKFTTIPANGLRDFAFKGEAPLMFVPKEYGDLTFKLQLHDYHSVEASQHYGNEGSLGLAFEPVKDHVVSIEATRYNADEFSTDTDKLWLTYEFKF